MVLRSPVQFDEGWNLAFGLVGTRTVGILLVIFSAWSRLAKGVEIGRVAFLLVPSSLVRRRPQFVCVNVNHTVAVSK